MQKQRAEALCFYILKSELFLLLQANHKAAPIFFIPNNTHQTGFTTDNAAYSGSKCARKRRSTSSKVTVLYTAS